MPKPIPAQFISKEDKATILQLYYQTNVPLKEIKYRFHISWKRVYTICGGPRHSFTIPHPKPASKRSPFKASYYRTK